MKSAVLLVADIRNGEQGGDRPTLNDLEPIIVQAPFDVLGVAEVRFDHPPQLRKSRHLGIRQRRLLLLLRVHRIFRVPPAGEARMATCLVAICLAMMSPSRTV